MSGGGDSKGDDSSDAKIGCMHFFLSATSQVYSLSAGTVVGPSGHRAVSAPYLQEFGHEFGLPVDRKMRQCTMQIHVYQTGDRVDLPPLR